MLGKKNESHAHKVLEVDASLQGNLVFKDAVYLNINGHFEGRLETKGDLSIGEKAVVKADIIGERITIAGHVTGNVTAATELNLTGTSRLIGDIRTPVLSIEKGGIFQGQSRTGSVEHRDDENGSKKGLLTLEEVAHYISVERSLITEWAENGKLPASRDGSNWRFEKERVDEWIANGRIV